MALFVFLRDGTVSRDEGVLLLVGFAAYLTMLVYSGGERIQSANEVGEVTWSDLLRVLVGLGLIVGGAHALVIGGIGVATRAGVSDWVIGVTVVAFGTSAPEFATSIVASYRGRTNLAIDDHHLEISESETTVSPTYPFVDPDESSIGG